MSKIKVGILILSYNAGELLQRTLERIPPLKDTFEVEILIADDASTIPTVETLNLSRFNLGTPIEICKHLKNLGYGGNQKFGYNYAIERHWEYVVLLHGDGQYAPEILESLLDDLISDKAAAIFGSRMKNRIQALKGGMPLYKWVGNQILSKIQNTVAKSDFSEWHSGYRAYKVSALQSIEFNSMSDGFDFDTQIILGLLQRDFKIIETPIPTHYGSEISHVNGFDYAVKILKHTLIYRLTKIGLTKNPPWLQRLNVYEQHCAPGSSHEILKRWIQQENPSNILDIGCGQATFSSQLRQNTTKVIGIDYIDEKNRAELDGFYLYDFDSDLKDFPNVNNFDVVILADVLEHIRSPDSLLNQAKKIINENGKIFVSLPNINHFYPRIRIAVGMFGYDQKGILDETHLKFFTPKLAKKMFARNGFQIERAASSRWPFKILAFVPVSAKYKFRKIIFPSLFSYQLIYTLTKAPDEA